MLIEILCIVLNILFEIDRKIKRDFLKERDFNIE